MSTSQRLKLLFVFLMMVSVHLFFFVGFTVSDDSLYLSQAQQFLAGDFAPPETHWGFRYTVVLPTAMLVALAGHSDHLLALIPLAYWILLVGFFFAFVQQVFDRNTALTAGILAATLPLFVVQSTILGVDIAEAFFLFAAFAAFYTAEQSGVPRWGCYFGAGILVGLALITRETAYGFFLVLAVFFFMGGYRRWRYYMAGLAGILLVLSIESIYYVASGESVLYRFMTIAQSHGTIGIKSGNFMAGSGNISDSRIFGPPLALLFNQEFGLLFWAAIASTAFLFIRKKKELHPLLRYTVTAAVIYFLWIGYSGAVRPLPRYFSFLALLAIIPIAMMVTEIRSRLLRYILILLLLGSNFAALSVENIYPRFAARAIAKFSLSNDTFVMTSPLEAARAKGFIHYFKNNDDNDPITANFPMLKRFVYAHVEGNTTPAFLDHLLIKENLLKTADPPKLLIGKILDFTQLGKFLPSDLYEYLAVRNPGVMFYNISIDPEKEDHGKSR